MNLIQRKKFIESISIKYKGDEYRLEKIITRVLKKNFTIIRTYNNSEISRYLENYNIIYESATERLFDCVSGFGFNNYFVQFKTQNYLLKAIDEKQAYCFLLENNLILDNEIVFYSTVSTGDLSIYKNGIFLNSSKQKYNCNFKIKNFHCVDKIYLKESVTV